MKLVLSCFFLQLCRGGNVPRQGRIITFPQSEDDTLDVLQSSPSVLARQNTPETSALIKQSRADEFMVAEIFEPPAGQRCPAGGSNISATMNSSARLCFINTEVSGVFCLASTDGDD